METPTLSSLRRTIEQCASDSHAGTRNFGQIVGALVEAGVESYYADFRAAATTYYMPSGEAIAVPLHASTEQIADAFSAQAMQEAVRGAQRGVVKYPEFLRLSHRAGCIGYMVWISGRHVSYFGRRGETHVERFPDASP